MGYTCKHCPLRLLSTTLTLKLLGQLRPTRPQGLCTYCCFSALPSWQKCLSRFLTPFMSVFKHSSSDIPSLPTRYCERETLPVTLSPSLVFFLTIPTTTSKSITDICQLTCVFTLWSFHQDMSATWQQQCVCYTSFVHFCTLGLRPGSSRTKLSISIC